MKIVFAAIVVVSGSMMVSAQTTGTVEPPVDVFWRELQKLCGKALAGTVAADTSKSPDFTGKPLVMHVRSCEKDRIRIPFFVGENRSRTWVLTKTNGRIQLKHDHRDADGKPDIVTMYGGTTTNTGEPTRQFFPADDETTLVVARPAGNAPSAAANVWWIELVPNQYFSYNLRRLGSERLFTVKFDITKPIAAPEPPWGWKDQ